MNRRQITGPDHPLFKSGKTVDSTGYVQLSSKVHGDDHRKREHRAVMERLLGRALLDGEVVHHKNGDKLDNTPGNLEVLSRAEHAREHHARGVFMACGGCQKQKWYSPANAARLAVDYQCRACRYGRTWDNRSRA